MILFFCYPNSDHSPHGPSPFTRHRLKKCTNWKPHIEYRKCQKQHVTTAAQQRITVNLSAPTFQEPSEEEMKLFPALPVSISRITMFTIAELLYDQFTYSLLSSTSNCNEWPF